MAALAAVAVTGCNPGPGSGSWTKREPLKMSVSEKNTTTGDETLTEWKYNSEAEIMTGILKIVSEIKTFNGSTVYVISDFETNESNATTTRYRTLADGTHEKLVSTFGYTYETSMFETKFEVFRNDTELVELIEVSYDNGNVSRYEQKVNGQTKLLRENFQYDDYSGDYVTWSESVDGGASVLMRRDWLKNRSEYEIKADRDGDGTPETLVEKREGHEETTFANETTVKYKISYYDAEGTKTSEIAFEEEHKWFDITYTY